jgi:glycosyltransferase involved in cell wall biosynthesis
MTATAATRRADLAADSAKAPAPAMLVSVLLPAWNEERMLDRCLASLVAIEDPPLDIVICAGGADATPAIAARWAAAHPDRITLLRQQAGEGKQAALRRCLERARGSILYLTDADCVVPADTVRRLADAVGAGADAATGPADPVPEQAADPWVRHQWATVRAVDRHRAADSNGLLGRNCAVRREAVEATGSFGAAVPIGTDYHLAKALLADGRTIRWVPAPVQTRYHQKFGPFLRQQSRWLRNILVHGRGFGDVAEVRGVARTIATGWAVLLWPLTWRWTRLPGVAVWLGLLGWLTRARLARLRALESEERLPPDRGWRAAAGALRFVVLDLVVWAYPAIDLARPGRRLRW